MRGAKTSCALRVGLHVHMLWVRVYVRVVVYDGSTTGV